MRINIVGPAYPYRGGIADSSECLARELQKEGHEVKMTTFTLQYPGFMFPGETQYAEESAKPNDLTICRRVNSCNPFNWISVGCELKKDAPDLIVIRYWLPYMSPCLGSIARIAQSNKKTKVVALIDNMLPHEKSVFASIMGRFFVSSADGFVTMSKSVMNDVETFDAEKPKVLSVHPIYDNFGAKVSREEGLNRLGLDANYRYLLFFGLIRDYKGLDLLLDAMANEKIDRSKVKLIVAGEYYSNKEKYEQQISSLGIADNLIMHTKFIPDEEVKYYFAAADAVVQPYKTATQSGITQVAYNFEKAMIVTNVGGLPEIVPHEKVGLVCEPDAEAVADAIATFLNGGSPDRYQEGILEEKKKYSWSRLASDVMKAGE
ncbi:MAG: glycosyltransferase [Bacteroidales bacterium]|nr:glycosyltransferase [Candidatus Physcocola equi]